MKVAIHQPNYAPWCGFFAKMNACDVFVFYDDAQMTKNSYINRCLINNQGRQTWLTIPVSFKLGDKINQVIISIPNLAVLSAYGHKIYRDETSLMLSGIVLHMEQLEHGLFCNLI